MLSRKSRIYLYLHQRSPIESGGTSQQFVHYLLDFSHLGRWHLRAGLDSGLLPGDTVLYILSVESKIVMLIPIYLFVHLF